jgi:epoxyqueuosine reductase
MTSLSQELEAKLVSSGAALVGFADVRALPEAARGGMPYGVSIGVALDPSIVATLGDGPTARYYAEYIRTNTLLLELGRVCRAEIEARGHHAAALASVTTGDANIEPDPGRIPHKTVATLSGLGWVGKGALVITPELGSAVRLYSVFTDAPVTVGKAISVSKCGPCVECVEACPAGAISGEDWFAGRERATFYDAYKCRDAARKMTARLGIKATICGVCIAACPFTRRYVRKGGKG